MRVYINKFDVFAFNKLGKNNFKIYIGIFDFDDNSVNGTRNVVLPKRDWITLNFDMLNN